MEVLYTSQGCPSQPTGSDGSPVSNYGYFWVNISEYESVPAMITENMASELSESIGGSMFLSEQRKRVSEEAARAVLTHVWKME